MPARPIESDPIRADSIGRRGVPPLSQPDERPFSPGSPATTIASYGGSIRTARPASRPARARSFGGVDAGLTGTS